MRNTEEFFAAIRSGDLARVETLLDAEPALAAALDGGTSAVLLAIYHSRIDVASAIAARKPGLSLHEASALGDAAAVTRLLAEGAAVNEPGADGHYPAGLAIFFGHPEIARTLIESGADVTLHSKNAQKVAPVHAAAGVCDRATMQLLLERGADPDARQQSDVTPLHGAASRGDVEMARLLLAHGADRAAKSADGKTAADFANEHGHAQFAAWIASEEG